MTKPLFQFFVCVAAIFRLSCGTNIFLFFFFEFLPFSFSSYLFFFILFHAINYCIDVISKQSMPFESCQTRLYFYFSLFFHFIANVILFVRIDIILLFNVRQRFECNIECNAIWLRKYLNRHHNSHGIRMAFIHIMIITNRRKVKKFQKIRSGSYQQNGKCWFCVLWG